MGDDAVEPQRRSTPVVDAAAAAQATGGWMTGVLFEAWRLG
jgi:hypothetical protein